MSETSRSNADRPVGHDDTNRNFDSSIAAIIVCRTAAPIEKQITSPAFYILQFLNMIALNTFEKISDFFKKLLTSFSTIGFRRGSPLGARKFNANPDFIGPNPL